MKTLHYLRSGVIAILLIVCAVAAPLMSAVSTGFRAAYNFGADVLRKTFAGPVDVGANSEQRPQSYIVAAAAFVSRLVKRERPTITAGWRNCPST